MHACTLAQAMKPIPKSSRSDRNYSAESGAVVISICYARQLEMVGSCVLNAAGAALHRRHSSDRRRLCSGGACTSASCCPLGAKMAPALDGWWGLLTDPSPRPSPAAYASRGAPVLASRSHAPCITRDAAVHERTWCSSSWRDSRDP